jgi:hypothetical protein
MFSPALSTWCDAIDAGRMTSWPDLTSAQVRRHPPRSEAMVRGHLDQQRANLRSTQPPVVCDRENIHRESTPRMTSPPHSFDSPEFGNQSPHDPDEAAKSHADDWNPQPDEPLALNSHFLYAECAEISGKIFTDQTGRFLATSTSGKKDLLVLYDYDSNYIHVEAMRDRTGAEILAAYQRAHTLLSSRGLRPQLQRLDNEASAVLQAYLGSQDVDFQLAPPHVHRRNAAERAIRTFKNHFIAGLCSTDEKFPIKLWDQLLPQALITLNTLRGSRINPQLSAWAQVHGEFNYNNTPLAPPGTRVLVHEKPGVRPSWSPHAVDGWYLGPALKHYRSYRVWITETGRERIADTLAWFPTQVVMPTASSAEVAAAAARDLITALQNPSPASPLAPMGEGQLASLQVLATIFADVADPADNQPDTVPLALPPPAILATLPPAIAPLAAAPAAVPTVTFAAPLVTAPIPRVAIAPSTTPPAATRPRVPATLPRVTIEPIIAIPTPAVDEDGFTYIERTKNAGQRRRLAAKAAKAAEKARESAAAQHHIAVATTPAPQPVALNPARQPPANSPHNTRSRTNIVATGHAANLAAAHLARELLPLENGDTFPDVWTANAVVDPVTGAIEEYAALKAKPGAEGEEWVQSMANELGRLSQGVLPHMLTGSDTLRFVPITALPPNKQATYLRIVTAERPNKAETKRVRCTVGGDRITYPGKVSTPTAELTTIKLMLNSVVSTPDAKFMTIDISDFYLGTPLDSVEYMRIPEKHIPEVIMTQYKLRPLLHNGSVLAEIHKGMYGLPQAGILANNRLQEHLQEHGYTQTPHTPGLFRHETRPVMFSLIVDDFGVQYKGREHAEHLITTLQLLYKITIDWSGTKYCGLTLDWNYVERVVLMSMPGYVEKALVRFQSTPPKRPQHSPHAWSAPTYGAATQYALPDDDSAPLDAAGTTRLQEIIGTLLFYARAVDSTMLVALGSLASAQAKGTQATAQAATHLLNYCATHPDAVVAFHKSGMGLHAHSDASYLSEREARSRVAGIFFLSDCALVDATPQQPDPNSPPPPFNGAVLVVSSILKSVMSSAAEAELGGLFYNCKEAAALRTTLADMGYPQPATPIQTDNACAAGIVNGTVKQRRSKAMDMRFYWVRDRVNKGEFLVHWRRGSDNLADYFTKHHSPAHHRVMRSRYLLELHRPLPAPSSRSSQGCVDELLVPVTGSSPVIVPVPHQLSRLPNHLDAMTTKSTSTHQLYPPAAYLDTITDYRSTISAA